MMDSLVPSIHLMSDFAHESMHTYSIGSSVQAGFGCDENCVRKIRTKTGRLSQ